MGIDGSIASSSGWEDSYPASLSSLWMPWLVIFFPPMIAKSASFGGNTKNHLSGFSCMTVNSNIKGKENNLFFNYMLIIEKLKNKA